MNDWGSGTMERTERGLSKLSASTGKIPLLFSSPDPSSCERAILNVCTKEFRTINNSCFEDSGCLFAEGEWMLMCKLDRHGCSLRSPFLLNQNLGRIIDLPRIDSHRLGLSTFSLVADVPDLIVHVDRDEYCGKIHIWATRPGHDTWDVHEVKCERGTLISAVVLSGTNVLCIDNARSSIVYDLLGGDALFISGPRSLGGRAYSSEFEGSVVSIHCPHPMFGSFKFKKLDWRRMEWVVMDDSELENTSWFLGRSHSFHSRGGGKTIYTLLPNQYEGPNPPILLPGQRTRVIRACPVGCSKKVNVYIHNLLDGTSEPLLPEAFLTQSALWIDSSFLN